MYSLLSDLQYESIYKSDGKYEFILNYPEMPGKNYNWWKQSLSPTIQTENESRINNDDHYVLGYEVVDINYPENSWGGLALTRNSDGALISGSINHDNWHYAIGSFRASRDKIPGPNYYYITCVALYAKVNNLNMIKCVSCGHSRISFLNFNAFIYCFITI